MNPTPIYQMKVARLTLVLLLSVKTLWHSHHSLTYGVLTELESELSTETGLKAEVYKNSLASMWFYKERNLAHCLLGDFI